MIGKESVDGVKKVIICGLCAGGVEHKGRVVAVADDGGGGWWWSRQENNVRRPMHNGISISDVSECPLFPYWDQRRIKLVGNVHWLCNQGLRVLMYYLVVARRRR